MGASCLECCKAVLLARKLQGPCQCSAGPPAPNGLTVLHAAALLNVPGAAASASAALRLGSGASAATAATTAELDAAPKLLLHLLLEGCGLRLTDEKHVSKYYRRLSGRTALEVAVALGHAAPARELLAAGAAVRPQAWAALLQHCPLGSRDVLAGLLASQQATPAALVAHWPASYRRAIQTLLLCAHHGRQHLASAQPPTDVAPTCTVAGPAAVVEADHGGAPAASVQGTALLPRLPLDVVLRVATLAAAPLSVW